MKSHKFNASPSWACRFCYQKATKIDDRKKRYCQLCNEGRLHSDSVCYWDSQSELTAWAERRMMEKAGIIKDLRLKPKFKLPLKSLRCYEADWSYTQDGKQVVEDLKGVETHIYRVKKELVEFLYPGVKIVTVKARR